MLTDERPELRGGPDERDQVDGRGAALEHQPAQPILGCGKPAHSRNSSDGGGYANPHIQSTSRQTGSQHPDGYSSPRPRTRFGMATTDAARTATEISASNCTLAEWPA